jgi:phage N-6-adenine-methyltransferase
MTTYPQQALFTKHRIDWETPQWLFDQLDAEFHFDLDVCATPENAKCSPYFTPEDDALTRRWDGTCWMNPPFGKGIARWVEKAYRSALAGSTVVCLLPVRSDTGWWHDYCMKGEIRFIRGRLQFGTSRQNAPFPCAVVVFRAGLRNHRQTPETGSRPSRFDGLDPASRYSRPGRVHVQRSLSRGESISSRRSYLGLSGGWVGAMSPTDRKAVATTENGRKVTLRTVFLEADEHLLLLRRGRGYVAAIPLPLCKHNHKRLDSAALCGIKAAQELAAEGDGLLGKERTE